MLQVGPIDFGFAFNVIQNEYLFLVVTLLSSVVVATVVDFIFRRYIAKLASKTKSDIDDRLVSVISKPLYTAIVLAGIYVGLIALTISQPYIEIIKDGFFVIYVIIVAFGISRIIDIFVEKWFKSVEGVGKTPKLIDKVANMVIYLIAIMMILGYFQIEITPIIATLGIGGLAVGLALQNTLTNFFAGLHIISDKPVRVGDYVELPADNVAGYVEDVGWRSTRIKTLPNNTVVIPNSKLAESIVLNDSMPGNEMGVVVQCGVSYNSNLKKVEDVTIDVAKKIQQTTKGAVKDFQPFIRFHTFADSNINFSIILRVQTFVDKYLVTHEFIKALKERYDKEGIEISRPIRKVYYGDNPPSKSKTKA